MKLAIFVLLSSFIILAMEVVKRRYFSSADISRRIIHICTSVVAAAAPFFVTSHQLVIVCLAFAVILFAGRTRKIFTAIYDVERRTYGEAFLPLGVALAAYFYLPEYPQMFQFGVLIMGISDALGGFVGDRFGHRRLGLFGTKKTLEGSAAFFVSSLIITFLFFPAFDLRLLFIPAILTAAELSLSYGADNLVLPILGAWLATFL